MKLLTKISLLMIVSSISLQATTEKKLALPTQEVYDYNELVELTKKLQWFLIKLKEESSDVAEQPECLMISNTDAHSLEWKKKQLLIKFAELVKNFGAVIHIGGGLIIKDVVWDRFVPVIMAGMASGIKMLAHITKLSAEHVYNISTSALKHEYENREILKLMTEFAEEIYGEQ